MTDNQTPWGPAGPHQPFPTPPPAPPAPPKSGVPTWAKIMAALAVVFVVGVVGCGAIVSVGVKNASDAVEERNAAIAEEVLLEGCDRDTVFDSPRAFGRVENGSSEMSDYWITVRFLNGGEVVATGHGDAQAVGPGESARWEAVVFSDVPAYDACELVSTNRWATT